MRRILRAFPLRRILAEALGVAAVFALLGALYVATPADPAAPVPASAAEVPALATGAGR